MDLQLNICTGKSKTKNRSQKEEKNVKTQHKNKSNDYNFVSKPSFDGKTIARKRKIPQNVSTKTNFSILNQSLNKTEEISNKNNAKRFDRTPNQIKNEEINTDSSEIKRGRRDKKKKIEKQDKSFEQEDVYDFTTETTKNNINNVQSNSRTENQSKKSFQKQAKQRSEKQQENTDKKEQNVDHGRPEVKKKSLYSQITALFRNNPDIPKIGQRLVKPINEKVFSGRNFEDLDIHSFSIANLEKNMGLKQLTVVQQKSSPVILKGRDVLVRSQTGSGKTLAYGLPIVEALQAIRPKLKRQDGVKALVIVPTRELALQTYELFIKLVKPFTWIVPGYLIGGEKRKAEKARIRKGFNILIGTPGRICDHLLHTASLKLGGTRCLVLDEADRLLDMGYEKDVSSIVKSLESHRAADKYDPMAMVRQSVKQSHIRFDKNNDSVGEDEEEAPSRNTEDESNAEATEKNEQELKYKHELSNVFMSDKRQTILLSATLTKAVETLAGLTMQDPVFIDASEGRATLIADSLATAPPAQTQQPKEEEEDIKEQQESDDDFEVVPLETSDQEDKNDESDEQSDSDDDCEEEEEDQNPSDAVSNNDNEENDGSDSSSDSDSDESKDSSDDEIDKSKLSVYKGLKAFTGFNLDQEEDKETKTKKSKKTKENNNDESSKKEKIKSSVSIKPATDGSDSDSDYDFFAVAKVDKKAIDSASSFTEDVETKTHFVTDSGDHSNPFQNAVQSAIAQDEMVIPSSVTQIYIVAPMKLRLVTLSALIIERCVKPGVGKMLVFMGTQDLIDYHCDLLSKVLAGKEPFKVKVEPKKDKSKNRTKDDETIEQNSADDEEKTRVKDNEDTGDEESESYKVKDAKKKTKKGKKNKMDVEEVKEAKKEISDDYDEMDLMEYEAKMRQANAYVNVEFFQLHGSMDQKTRTEVFKTFRKATSGVLLCTDVAARGLDLPHVDCIVQYTGPISATDYVHRVGRTARAGNVGTAIMLLLPSEVLFVRQLEERRIRLHQEDMEVSLRSLVPERSGKDKYGPPPTQAAAAQLQQTFEELVQKDKELHVKGCKAFTSWLRFYSTYPREARAAFDRKALHMGHAARALALSDTPKKIAREAPKPVNRKESDLKRKAEKMKSNKGPAAPKAPSAKSANREKRMLIGEFESGLEPPKKKLKKK